MTTPEDLLKIIDDEVNALEEINRLHLADHILRYCMEQGASREKAALIVDIAMDHVTVCMRRLDDN
jgi:hypothetical protein